MYFSTQHCTIYAYQIIPCIRLLATHAGLVIRSNEAQCNRPIGPNGSVLAGGRDYLPIKVYVYAVQSMHSCSTLELEYTRRHLH